MEPIIKKLSEETDRLIELNGLFAIEFDDAETYQSKKPSDSYLNEWLDNEDNIAIVAVLDNAVVGGLAAYTLHKLEQERSEVYVYDLAVSRDHRRSGIGRKLVDEVRKIAAKQGSWVVFVQADEGDEAIKFYESLNPTENNKTRSFDLDVIKE